MKIDIKGLYLKDLKQEMSYSQLAQIDCRNDNCRYYLEPRIKKMTRINKATMDWNSVTKQSPEGMMPGEQEFDNREKIIDAFKTLIEEFK